MACRCVWRLSCLGSQFGTFTRGCSNEQAVAGCSAWGLPSSPHYPCPSVPILTLTVVCTVLFVCLSVWTAAIQTWQILKVHKVTPEPWNDCIRVTHSSRLAVLAFWAMTDGTLERWSIQDILLWSQYHSVLCQYPIPKKRPTRTWRKGESKALAFTNWSCSLHTPTFLLQTTIPCHLSFSRLIIYSQPSTTMHCLAQWFCVTSLSTNQYVSSIFPNHYFDNIHTLVRST